MQESPYIWMYRHERTRKQVCNLEVRGRSTFARCGQYFRNHGCIVCIGQGVELDEYLGDLGVTQSGCSLHGHKLSLQSIGLVGN